MLRLPLLTSTLLLLSICCRTGSFFTVDANTSRVSVGGAAQLNCRYFVQDCASVRWIVPGPRTYHQITNPRDGNSELIIANVTERDEGIYSCICTENRTINDSTTLTVIHPPHLRNVALNQAFRNDTKATILCNAFHGDPRRELIWKLGRDRLYNGINGYIIVSDALVFDPIEERHAGTYQCGFDTPNGLSSAFITVNVLPSSVPSIELPEEVEVDHDEPLNLTCITNPADILGDYVYTWQAPGLRGEVMIIHNQSIYYAAGNVSPGYYTCRVQIPNGGENSWSVNVRVHNRPEFINRHKSAFAHVGDILVFHEKLRAPLTTDTVDLQWKVGDRLVNFDSRTRVTVADASLHVIISDAKLEDKGTYELNVSNQYGYDVVNVTFNVTPTPSMIKDFRFQIMERTCQWLKEHKDAIVNGFKVQYCGGTTCDDDEISIISSEIICSSLDDGIALLEISLESLDPLPPITEFNVIVDGEVVSLISCPETQDCLTSPSPPPPPSPPTSLPSVDNITPVVVGAVITVAVVVMVLVLTLLIWKGTNRFCGNHRIAQEDNNKLERGENLEVQRIDPNQSNQPECIGYISVSHGNQPVQPVCAPGETTPVTLPFSEAPVPPPHQLPTQPSAQLPAQPSAQLPEKLPAQEPSVQLPAQLPASAQLPAQEPSVQSPTVCPPRAPAVATTATGIRPNRLFLRSNSYHGSTRTRTPPS